MTASDRSAKPLQEFYVQADAWLERLWGGSSHMIHFGFYPQGTARSTSHRQSLFETVHQAALRLSLHPGDKILDAGCGIGGAAVWLAKTYKVQVDGIANVPLHVERATRYARECGILAPGPVSFSLADYTNTGFASQSYDGIVAIESVCYASDKMAFFSEAYRLLKPGGRLVIVDGFRTRRCLSEADEHLMTSWLSGWGAGDINTADELCGKAREAGFIAVEFEDLQANFRPSHRLSYCLARLLQPAVWLLNRLGLLPDVIYGHCRACRDLYLAVERGLCLQGIVSASKPAQQDAQTQ